jgi:hypothetical protein
MTTAITTDYVPKDYIMDPEAEVLIPHGTGLRNGMIVLTANPDLRTLLPMIEQHDKHWRPRILQKHTKSKLPEGTPKRYRTYPEDYVGADMEAVREALKWNRWCTISHIETRQYVQMNDYVVFVGTYGDDSQFKLSADVDNPWFMKKSPA